MLQKNQESRINQEEEEEERNYKLPLLASRPTKVKGNHIHLNMAQYIAIVASAMSMIGPALKKSEGGPSSGAVGTSSRLSFGK